MITKSLDVPDLLAVPGASPTGAIPIYYDTAVLRWMRARPGPICPLSALILAKQPGTESWVRAASWVTGWTERRVFAFKSKLRSMIGIEELGAREAVLYALAYKSLQRQGVKV